MATNKNQHYVPKCYLRAFASDDGQRSTNIYNLRSGAFIKGAPIRQQCVKTNFYGKDLVLERAFQPLEGAYAAALNTLLNTGRLGPPELETFRRFIALQSARTETAAKRIFASQADMAALIFRDEAEHEQFGRMTEKQALIMSLQHAEMLLHMTSDLAVRLFRNDTKIDFLTSDDPVVSCNRLVVAKEKRLMGGAGLGTAGLTIYFPISPRYLLVLFDKFVYAPQGFAWNTIPITKPADILAVNCLQYIKCNQLLYFSRDNQRDLVRSVAEMSLPHRPEQWHTVNIAVPDKVHADGKSYKVVTSEEAKQHDEAMVHLHSKPLTTPVWFSGMPFRTKPRFIDTRTGRGLVRLGSP